MFDKILFIVGVLLSFMALAMLAWTCRRTKMVGWVAFAGVICSAKPGLGYLWQKPEWLPNIPMVGVNAGLILVGLAAGIAAAVFMKGQEKKE